MKKIYLIDDNENAIKIVNRAILNSIKDVEIIIETHGIRGLELIKAGNPDLIILDIKLPGMNGIDICKELRKIKKFKKIPIIAFTALEMSEIEQILLNSGFDKCIPKPFILKYFLQYLRDILNITN